MEKGMMLIQLSAFRKKVKPHDQPSQQSWGEREDKR